ncbi:MAG: FAD-binding oxidoreductase [Alphaproteobacteria bacterium]|nr:FAD-binding oxidoreductase [Alphaproteobacteria bacterium]
MRRREWLQVMAGVALSGVPRVWAAPRRVVIVGSGILGASIAYHLVRRGADVTVVEKHDIATGATANSFAWLNANYSKRPRPYFELNRLGLMAYRHLDAELDGGLAVQWGGSVEWHDDAKRAAALKDNVAFHQVWGYGTRLIEAAELNTLEPKVRPGPVVTAAYCDQEGHVDPVNAVRVLVARARKLGARVLTQTEVKGIERTAGRISGVTTSQGSLPAETVVVACGVDTGRVAALAGVTVPLKDSPGLIAHTTPLPRLLGRVVLAPGAHMKQTADGRILTADGFGGSPTTDQSKAMGLKLLSNARRFLPDLPDAFDRVTLGWRPLPKDDRPIVGYAPQAPGLYVTVMHSGMTMAPIIGRLAASEILDGIDVDLLSTFRLSRFGL